MSVDVTCDSHGLYRKNILYKKIAGCKHPALVDPVHKVRRGKWQCYVTAHGAVPCEVLLYKVLGACRAPLVVSIWQSVSWVNFWSAEGVPPRLGSISGRQNMFRQIPGKFLADRVCSASLWPFSGQKSVFCTFLGQFLVGRVCSAASLVYLLSTECVPPCLGSILKKGTSNLFACGSGLFF